MVWSRAEPGAGSEKNGVFHPCFAISSKTRDKACPLLALLSKVYKEDVGLNDC